MTNLETYFSQALNMIMSEYTKEISEKHDIDQKTLLKLWDNMKLPNLDKNSTKSQMKSSTKFKKGRNNGYLIFCKENREKVKTEMKGSTPQEISKELGKRWRELTKENREAFSNRAKEMNKIVKVEEDEKKDEVKDEIQKVVGDVENILNTTEKSGDKEDTDIVDMLKKINDN